MSNPKTHPDFKLIGTHPVPAMGLTVELYEHIVTGAIHFHMACDNTENMFMVMFRTMPKDSTGVAHILEHTALCGSEKFPVRDPFFTMIKRSLQTFMNAFTSCDWTAYPFSSANKKDFNNLLEVYLDSAFFPLLRELDFRQEGHRLEFAEEGNKESPLTFTGVVFNEMKGAMSPPERVLGQAIQSALCPGTTYEVNSGGEPANIPQLTYQAFKDFHSTHYHPTNAVFFTYGDIPAVDHQQKFQDNVLHRFTKAKVFTVPDVERFSAPKYQHIHYPFDVPAFDDEGNPTDVEKAKKNRTFVQMGWLLGQSSDAYERFKTAFLQLVLLGDSSAPLMAALESSKLGKGPSPLLGADENNKEISFMAGLQGSEVEHAKAVEKLILDTLKKVAKDGIPANRVNALLDQMEADIRDQEASGYPLGLKIAFNLFAPATHGGDLLHALDLDPVLDKLRTEAADPNFVRNMVKEMLLDNPHRVTMVSEPDETLSATKNKQEADTLLAIKAAISNEEMDRIIAQSAAIKERQNAKEDLSCLPKVSINDVEPDKTYPVPKDVSGAVVYEGATNGMVTERITVDLPALTARQMQLLPLYAALVTEIGVGKRSYLEVGEWQSSICTRFQANESLHSKLGNTDEVSAYITFYAKGLARHSAAMVDMMVETIADVSFAEHDRIRDIIGQVMPRFERRTISDGHSSSILAATRNMSALGNIDFKAEGLEGLRFLKDLAEKVEADKALASLADELVAIHALVKESPRRTMTVAEPSEVGGIAAKLAASAGSLPVNGSFNGFVADKATGAVVGEMWIANTAANYCAKAYKAVPSTHPDAPALHVLAGYLKNNFIHRAIREQGGAYGGMVVYSAENGTFTFASYRDPRLSGTLADYDAAVAWIQSHKVEADKMEEAVLGIVGSIDKPQTPMNEAGGHFSSNLHGRTDAVRSDYRKRVLAVTPADVERVAKTYLIPANASVAVITSEAGLKAEGDLGMKVIKL